MLSERSSTSINDRVPCTLSELYNPDDPLPRHIQELRAANATLPISQLPVELMRVIFELVVHEHRSKHPQEAVCHDSRLAITAVSFWWRAIALNDSSAWKFVYYDLRDPEPYTSRFAVWTEHCVKRSGVQPLHLHVDGVSSDDPSWRPIKQEQVSSRLAPVVNRMVALSTDSLMVFVTVMKVLSEPSLVLSHAAVRGGAICLPADLNTVLHNAPQIEHLRLESWRSFSTELGDILGGFSALRHLTLKSFDIAHIKISGTFRHHISLPSVELLELISCDALPLRSFFAPKLREVVIHNSFQKVPQRVWPSRPRFPSTPSSQFPSLSIINVGFISKSWIADEAVALYFRYRWVPVLRIEGARRLHHLLRRAFCKKIAVCQAPFTLSMLEITHRRNFDHVADGESESEGIMKVAKLLRLLIKGSRNLSVMWVLYVERDGREDAAVWQTLLKSEFGDRFSFELHVDPP